jgi:hypothetical protein
VRRGDEQWLGRMMARVGRGHLAVKDSLASSPPRWRFQKPLTGRRYVRAAASHTRLCVPDDGEQFSSVSRRICTPPVCVAGDSGRLVSRRPLRKASPPGEPRVDPGTAPGGR